MNDRDIEAFAEATGRVIRATRDGMQRDAAAAIDLLMNRITGLEREVARLNAILQIELTPPQKQRIAERRAKVDATDALDRIFK
jgi:hypothetical protein